MAQREVLDLRERLIIGIMMKVIEEDHTITLMQASYLKIFGKKLISVLMRLRRVDNEQS
ncbi:hypothetical protein [Legionella israelensis]|nr:hypothetical protein [Legionella israelensis]